MIYIRRKKKGKKKGRRLGWGADIYSRRTWASNASNASKLAERRGKLTVQTCQARRRASAGSYESLPAVSARWVKRIAAGAMVGCLDAAETSSNAAARHDWTGTSQHKTCRNEKHSRTKSTAEHARAALQQKGNQEQSTRKIVYGRCFAWGDRRLYIPPDLWTLPRTLPLSVTMWCSLAELFRHLPGMPRNRTNRRLGRRRRVQRSLNQGIWVKGV